MSISREAEEANLALLVCDAYKALTNEEKESATKVLQEFVDNTPFPNLRTRAQAAISIVAAGTRQQSMSDMKKLLDGISELDEAFKTAARVAADGEKNLFFPRLASSLGQIEALLVSLKEQFEGISAEINTLSEGVDVAKLKHLSDSVKNASSEIRNSLDKI